MGNAPNCPSSARTLEARTVRGDTPRLQASAGTGPSGRAAVYHSPPRGAKRRSRVNSPHPGVNSRRQLRFILVATNLHLWPILLIFRWDKCEKTSAVPDVGISDDRSVV